VCGDRIVKKGGRLTEKLVKLNEVYDQVIASSNLITQVRLTVLGTQIFYSLKIGFSYIYNTLIYISGKV
jgi:ABC-type protease/lipase transport system fused ATPase/permease subunit